MIRLLAILLILLLTSCANLGSLLKNSKPSIEDSSLSLKSLSLKDIGLNLKLKIKNPNPVSLPVEFFNYQLIVNDKPFFSGKTESFQSVKASSSSDFNLPITIALHDIYHAITNIKNTIPIQLKADLAIRVPVYGIVKLPISLKIDIPIPKIPKLQIISFKKKKLSFTKASFELKLKILNQNKETIELNNLFFNFHLNKINLARIKNDGQHKIEKNKDLLFTIDVDVLKLGYQTIRNLIESNSLNYELNGSCNFSMNIPFFKSEDIKLSLKGTL